MHAGEMQVQTSEVELAPRWRVWPRTRDDWRHLAGTTAVWDACDAAFAGRRPALVVRSHAFKRGRDATVTIRPGSIDAVIEETFNGDVALYADLARQRLPPQTWNRHQGRALAELALWFHRRDGYSPWRDHRPVAARLTATLDDRAAPRSFAAACHRIAQWEEAVAHTAATSRAELHAYIAALAAQFAAEGA